jgi:hypothetical protein
LAAAEIVELTAKELLESGQIPEESHSEFEEKLNSLENPTPNGWSIYNMFAYSFQLYGFRVGSEELSTK